MIKQFGLIVAGSLLLALPARSQDRPPTPPAPPPASTEVRVGQGSYLGVVLEEVDAEHRAKLNLAEESGAVIAKVTKESPAAQAGLKESDVVVGWNGTRIESARQLARMIRETPAGRKVTLDVIRDGHRMSHEVTIGARPTRRVEVSKRLNIDLDSLSGRMHRLRGRMDSLGRMFADSMVSLNSGGHPFAGSGHGFEMFFNNRGRLGVELQSLTPQLAKFFGAESGALVSSVPDSGAARAAGLQAGDVIVAIDGKQVQRPADVSKILREKNEGPVELRIVRDKREQSIRVDLPKKSEMGSWQFDVEGEGSFSLGAWDPEAFEELGEQLRLELEQLDIPEMLDRDGIPMPPMPPTPPGDEFENLPDGSVEISNS